MSATVKILIEAGSSTTMKKVEGMNRSENVHNVRLLIQQMLITKYLRVQKTKTLVDLIPVSHTVKDAKPKQSLKTKKMGEGVGR